MSEKMHTMDELRMRQALPLSMKIQMTNTRIREWVRYYGEDGVYISFSGGKDSTVLVDLVDKCLPGNEIPLVYIDTGLEYPEIREFVKSYGERVVWLRPKMQFKKVIETYGYPLVSKEVSQKVSNVRKNPKGYAKQYFISEEEGGKKAPFNYSKWSFLISSKYLIGNKCCDIMKKNPAHKYSRQTQRVAITGQTASESQLRTTQWLKSGCNAFDATNPVSNPLSTWTEQDILQYIKQNNLSICSVYGDIVEDTSKTGQLEGQMNLSDYADECGGYDIGQTPLKTTGCDRTGCMFCLYGAQCRGDERLVRMRSTHPKQYEWMMKSWNEGGLGYRELIDWFNENSNSKINY